MYLKAKARMSSASAKYVRPLVELDSLKDVYKDDVGIFAQVDLVMAGFKAGSHAVLALQEASRLCIKAAKMDEGLTYVKMCTMKKNQMLLAFSKERLDAYDEHVATPESVASDEVPTK